MKHYPMIEAIKIRLPLDQKQALDRQAVSNGGNVSMIIRDLIQTHIVQSERREAA